MRPLDPNPPRRPPPSSSSHHPSTHMNMKLLPRRITHHHRRRPSCSSRWVILFSSLSLYFLFFHFSSSSLFPSPHVHLFTITSKKFTSRALIETSPLRPTTTTNNPIDPMSIRIYIYDIPPSYNSDWLTDPRCSTHLFAAEVALHRALLSSPIRTTDPTLADFFFVPVYVSCNFSTPNGFPSLSHARPLLASAVQLVSSRFPFWNRSSGSDHVFVASHDYGACFHAMEHAAVADGIPDFLRNSIILQTFGITGHHPCQAAEHVVIPPYVPPESVDGHCKSSSSSSPAGARRDIFVYFRGKMEVHPKNVSGYFYGKGLRTRIWRRYSGDRRFHLHRKRSDSFRSEIARSVFCVCPIGWAPWSPRLVESVALGCVPVIVADGIRLPFSDAVPWSEISVVVPERDVGEMDRVLDRVARTNLSAIQRRLWDPAVRKALLFHRQIQEGDATWHVMRALAGKLSRSGRMRLADTQ